MDTIPVGQPGVVGGRTGAQTGRDGEGESGRARYLRAAVTNDTNPSIGSTRTETLTPYISSPTAEVRPSVNASLV